jgi:hypothetical protein
LVTVALGSGAAWQAARAIAQTWRPWWQAVLYMFMLGAALRLIQFALFDRPSLAAYDTAGDHLCDTGLSHSAPTWRDTVASTSRGEKARSTGHHR